MKRSATVLTTCLALTLAACSRDKAPEPTSPIEAPAAQNAVAVGYACESGRTIAVSYPDDQTARVRYEGKDYLLTSAVAASGARYKGEGLEWHVAGRGEQEGGILSRIGDGTAAPGKAPTVIERCSRPVAAAAPPPTGAPCASSDLRLTVVGGDAGMGHRLTTLALRNAGAATCTMTGYPQVALLDDDGQALTGVRSKNTPGNYFSQGQAPTSVELRPQQNAYFDLAWSVVPQDDEDETGCPSAKTVRVTAPGATGAVALSLAFTPCGGKVDVSPVRPVADASDGPSARATE